VRSSIDCTWLDWRASREPSLSVVMTQLAPELSPPKLLPPELLPAIDNVPVMAGPLPLERDGGSEREAMDEWHGVGEEPKAGPGTHEPRFGLRWRDLTARLSRTCRQGLSR
jgi:hypothetical protein